MNLNRRDRWLLWGIVIVIGVPSLALICWWMRSYAEVAHQIGWECAAASCATNDMRSTIPLVGWAVVCVVAFLWLALPGSGFFSGVAFLIFAGAWAAGYADAAALGQQTQGVRIMGIVAACIGAVLMLFGVIFTALKLFRKRPTSARTSLKAGTQ